MCLLALRLACLFILFICLLLLSCSLPLIRFLFLADLPIDRTLARTILNSSLADLPTAAILHQFVSCGSSSYRSVALLHPIRAIRFDGLGSSTHFLEPRNFFNLTKQFARTFLLCEHGIVNLILCGIFFYRKAVKLHPCLRDSVFY